MLWNYLHCCRRRAVEVDDEFELVECSVITAEEPAEGLATYRGVSAARQEIARRAGIEARAKLQGAKDRVSPVAQETPGGRLKNRVWVVVRTKDSVVLGKVFDRWSAASTFCLDRDTRVLADTSILHGWPSKVEADVYLQEALRGSRR